MVRVWKAANTSDIDTYTGWSFLAIGIVALSGTVGNTYSTTWDTE